MKRLLNKKGSVLFLVLVVMSLLIIAASATYYVVNNQRSSVNIRYSSEQAYQTATSMSETVSNYIDSYCKKIGVNGNVSGIKDHEDNIITKMLALEDGKSFTTDKIDFSNFAMGDAQVVIKKNKTVVDEETGQTDYIFDISTEAVINDEKVTVTQTKKITTSKYVKVADPFTRFLTSTGKSSEALDTYLQTGSIYGEAFFDNEYTSIGSRVNTSIYSTGTLVDNGIDYGDCPKYDPYVEIVIAENFLMETSQNDGPTINNCFVGGDMSLCRNWDVKNTYVKGDITITKNGINGSGSKIFVENNAYVTESWTIQYDLYVKGDLYVESNSTTIDPNKYHVGGKVYHRTPGASDAAWEEYEGSVAAYDESKLLNSIVQIGGDEGAFEIKNWDDVQAYIEKKASKEEYIEWDAENYFDNTLNAAGTLPTIKPGSDGASTVNITGSCILEPSDWVGGDKDVYDIIIDTEAAGNTVYIKFKPKSGEDTFYFKDPFGWSNLNVIVKGSYSVIFILPKDVNYQSTSNTFIGHEGVAVGATNLKYGASYKSYEELKNDGKGALRINCFNEGHGSTEFSNLKSMITVTSEGDQIFASDKVISNTHNNIYLVTAGDNNKLSFDSQATFCGYVYAPHSVLTCGAALKGTTFMGGIVVSNYTYITAETALFFNTPYDYTGKYKPDGIADADYNKADIVKILMGQSGAKVPGSEDGDITILSGWENIGYR